jgi:hypothetical protein
MSASTVSRVIHPDTGKTLALEIADNYGGVYFMAADKYWAGLRAGAFPNQSTGKPFPREEIARLETDA